MANKKQTVSTYSASSMYNQGVELIRKNIGVDLSLNPFAGDQFGFHDLFYKTRPEYCYGITYPEDFYWWSPVFQEDLARIELKIGELYIKNLSATETEAVSMLAPVFNPLLEEKLFRQLVKVVKRLLSLEPRHNNSRGICIIPEKDDPYWETYVKSDNYPKAFLPPPSWFNSYLQDLEIGDILTYLPPAEQKIFALTIGRAVVGPNKTKHVMTDRIIKHSWRTASITTGTPGTGKTTVCEHLKEALESVGYNVASFATLNKQFGIAEIITADWAYADDLNAQTFKELIESGIIKQVVTGGTIRTEKKYLDEVESRPLAAICCNINEFDINATYGADAGVLDRLKILRCHMPFDLKRPDNVATISQKSPELHPIPHIQWLCEELNCSKNALFLRFARLCADYFLELETKEQLNTEVKDISLHLGIQLHTHYDKVIVLLFHLCYLMRYNPSDGYGGKITELKPLSLGKCVQAARVVVLDQDLMECREIIKQDWTEKGKPQFHPWSGLKLLDPLTVDNAAKQFENLLPSSTGKSTENAIKAIYGELRLNQGFNVPPNIGMVARCWDYAREQGDSLLELANKIRESIKGKKNDKDELLIDKLDCKVQAGQSEWLRSPNSEREQLVEYWRIEYEKSRNGNGLSSSITSEN